MDAKEFVRQVNRMCGHYADGISCTGCPANNIDCFDGSTASERLVDIIEQWAKEHPVKTRQSEFLKLFPNADTINIEGVTVLRVCPARLDMTLEQLCREKDCNTCYKDYWLEEIE